VRREKFSRWCQLKKNIPIKNIMNNNDFVVVKTTGAWGMDFGKKCKKTRGFPTEVSDMARNMKMELLTFSLYCISRKTVDTEYTYYS
jgi:hypothetical protein